MILKFYRPPLGLPLRWQDEQSGVLPNAIKAFFKNEANEEQISLVKAWLKYYIDAPCWIKNATEDETRTAMATLRETVEALKEANEILDWIYKCLELGIDPL